MRQEYSPASFKILSFIWMHGFLDSFPYIFQSPGNISYIVKPIYDYRCSWEKDFSKFSIRVIHTHNEVFYFLAIRKALKICNKGGLRSVRKNIKYFMMNRICQYSLKLLASSISTKFIYRKYLGKSEGLLKWIPFILLKIKEGEAPFLSAADVTLNLSARKLIQCHASRVAVRQRFGTREKGS